MRKILGLGLAAALLAAPAAQAQSVAWSRSINGPANAAAYLGDGYIITRSLATDAAGNVVATGSTVGAGRSDFLTTKLAANTGAVVWQKVFSGAGGKDDDAQSVAVDASGNAIVAGLSFNAAGAIEAKVIKYAAADGAVMWERSLPSGTFSAAFVVALDANGNAFIGAEGNPTGNSDIRVIKLAAATGATIWDQAFNGGADDYISDLAVDSAGNVVVIGVSVNAVGDDDFKILKYNGASGAVLWQQTFNGGTRDEAYTLALDGAGNVFMTGYTTAANSNFKTIKFASGTGAIVWQATYDGGGNDAGQSVATDAAGNAIVTGQSQNASGRWVFKTLKYAAADGAVLWQKTFDSGTDSYAYQVAVDGAGNAIVAGSVSNGANADWKTIAYAAADGAVLFENGYAGSGNLNDEAFALAFAPGAVVVGGVASESGLPAGVRVAKLAYAAPATVALLPGELDARRLDFNGDGKSDLLMQHADGSLRVLLMNGLAATETATILGASGGPTVTKAGDFDGDGKTDIARQFSDGSVFVYLMNGATIAATSVVRPAGSGWRMATVGDFNGDGKTDIIWQHTDGTVEMTLMNGGSIASSATLMPAGTGWSVTKVGDFNGDGKSDLVWTAADGSVGLWLMNGGAVLERKSQMAANTGWAVAHVADFNGDGKSDFLWTHADGSAGMWLMNGTTILQRGPVMGAGLGWTPRQAGDMNGDGKADLLWGRSDGTIGLWLMNGLAIADRRPQMDANTGWRPARYGDFNGDGKTDIVWAHTDGSVGLWLMNGLDVLDRRGLQGPATGWSVLP
jgi:hypothetical protein